MLHGLRAHLPPVRDDDVAELTLERAPARCLHAAKPIPIDFEECDARRRAVAHVDLVDLDVMIPMRAAVPFRKELWPGVLAFAFEQDIAMRPAALRQDVADRATHANQPAPLTERVCDLEETSLLNGHRRQDDQVARGIEVDRFD